MDIDNTAHLPHRTMTGLFLLLLGANFLVIGIYGTGMPYFDQWTAEGLKLFLPWLEGRLTWGDMFRPFNEHHVFTARLLALVLFELNNQVWSVVLQECVNAVIHTVTLMILVRALLPACPPAWRRSFLLICALVLVIPLGWENLLCSFQTQIYGMMLFSLLFVCQIADTLPLSRRWWLALPWAGLAYLSQAPAVVALATGAVITLAYARNPAQRKAALAGSAILLALALAGFMLTPLMLDTPMRRGFHETSLWQRADGLLTLLAWPVHIIEWLALLMWSPFFVFCWRWWRRPDNLADRRIITIGFWVLLMCLGIAWGRGLIPLEPRYQDILVMGTLVGLVCLLRWLDATRPGGVIYRIAQLWTIALGVGLIMQVIMAHDALVDRKSQGDRQLSWIQHYEADLAAGRPHPGFNGQPSYPDAFSPVPFLSHPELVPVLPGVQDATSARQALWVRLWLAALTPVAIAMTGLGSLLFGTGLLRRPGKLP